VLATGNKHGYVFVVSLTIATPTSPASFAITVTPRAYRRATRLSFFVDESGVVRGADHHGGPANENDPIIGIDGCSDGSIAENEQCTIRNMRTVHSAQVTYYATSGNGTSYGTLAQLAEAGLISVSLGSGQIAGYSISAVTFPQTPTELARYSAIAVPQIYGTTGVRSFYVDETGVIRAADHQGGPANENDPPITD
jgi:hypothetical protein